MKINPWSTGTANEVTRSSVGSIQLIFNYGGSNSLSIKLCNQSIKCCTSSWIFPCMTTSNGINLIHKHKRWSLTEQEETKIIITMILYLYQENDSETCTKLNQCMFEKNSTRMSIYKIFIMDVSNIEQTNNQRFVWH